jgi:hypothetical protein
MKVFYLGAAILGAVIPCSWMAPWLREHGLDASRFLSELFSTRVGAFFGLDVLVSAVVLVGFIVWEGQRSRMKGLWMPVAATFTIGVSCGLPLFLFMRERNSVTPDTSLESTRRSSQPSGSK